MRLRKRFIKIIIGSVILIIACVILAQHGLRRYNASHFDNVYFEYNQIVTWQDAKDKFEQDLKENDLKYFYSGIYYDKSFNKIKRKYDLDVIGLGCFVQNNLNKYNYYVESLVITEYLGSLYFSRLDSIWAGFIRAIDTKDKTSFIDYSYDSILCTSIIFDLKGGSDFYNSNYLFDAYSDKIASFEYKSSDRSSWIEDSVINYYFTYDSLPKTNMIYNLRFTFQQENGRFYFKELILQ